MGDRCPPLSKEFLALLETCGCRMSAAGLGEGTQVGLHSIGNRRKLLCSFSTWLPMFEQEGLEMNTVAVSLRR